MAPADAAGAPPFAGVPWLSSAVTVKAILQSKGFTFIKVDSDGDLDFSGAINGKNVRVYAFLTPARTLVKMQVVFVTSNDEALNYYVEMKATLSTKYGAPAKHYEFWMDPYTEADSESEHETALAVGKGVFSSFWEFSDGGGLYEEITKGLAVSLNYESPGWHIELQRRKNSGNSVL